MIDSDVVAWTGDCHSILFHLIYLFIFICFLFFSVLCIRVRASGVQAGHSDASIRFILLISGCCCCGGGGGFPVLPVFCGILMFIHC